MTGRALDPPPAGNQRAVTHGASAALRLAPRADEIAAEVRQLVPVQAESDEIAVRLLALTLARIEAASLWLDEHGLFRNQRGDPQPIVADLNRWTNTAAKFLAALGLTTVARAGLNLDTARVAEIATDLAEGRRLRLIAEENRGELVEGDVEDDPDA